jgi:hypothetical protein
MTMTSNRGAGLQALMAVAELYARRLVADPGPPPPVLLLERAGDLDVVVLDGEGYDVIPQVRLLLGRSGANSAALLVETPAAATGTGGTEFWIVGESLDGATARRRYRVRPCGRARRLTPLADGDDPDVEGPFRPLFPVHLRPEHPDDGVVEVSSAAVLAAPPDMTPTSTTGRIVAA